MGTNSTIKFINKYNDGTKEVLVNIYQQYDGYIDGGVGHELAAWLLKKKLINGIGLGQNTKEYANGIGCLAAQYIKDHKHEVGYLYIYPPTVMSYHYNYEVIIHDQDDMPPEGVPLNSITTIRVYYDEELIFSGSPQELLDFKEE